MCCNKRSRGFHFGRSPRVVLVYVCTHVCSRSNNIPRPISWMKMQNPIHPVEVLKKLFLKLSTPCLLAGNFFFLFELNAHSMFNTYIYRLLPPSRFDFCCTVFRETTVLFAQDLYTFFDVVTWVMLENIKYALRFKICNTCYNV